MEHLKCPFCGANAELRTVQGRSGWFGYIECTYCGARSRNEFAGRDEKPYFGADGVGPWFHWNKRLGIGTIAELDEISGILSWFDDFALMLSTECGLTDDEVDLFRRKYARLAKVIHSALTGA